MADQSQIAQFQQRLVEIIRRQHLLRTQGVEAAFRVVPRHLFLPDVPVERAYQDDAIPLKTDERGLVVSSASQPTMMAHMLDQLNLQTGHNVLEIGTASGYNAALMKTIVGPDGHVTTIEIDNELAQQAIANLREAHILGVNVVPGDGAQGYSPRASYDHIVVTAGIWDVPLAWVRQLKPRGSIVTPISLNGVQVSARFILQPDGTLLSEDNRPCAFVFLRGQAAMPDHRRQIGHRGLTVLAEDLEEIDTTSLDMLLSDDQLIYHLEPGLNPSDYWYGFQLYLMLNVPEKLHFLVWSVSEDSRAYGLEGQGIALFGGASATFAPYKANGIVYCYAGTDSYLALQASLDDWIAAGQPRAYSLRLRLIPVEGGEPEVTTGRIFQRRDHYLHVWMETEATSEA